MIGRPHIKIRSGEI